MIQISCHSTDSFFQAEIAFHVWTGERNLIATDKIVSSLESVNARKFVQDHYLALVKIKFLNPILLLNRRNFKISFG